MQLFSTFCFLREEKAKAMNQCFNENNQPSESHWEDPFPLWNPEKIRYDHELWMKALGHRGKIFNKSLLGTTSVESDNESCPTSLDSILAEPEKPSVAPLTEHTCRDSDGEEYVTDTERALKEKACRDGDGEEYETDTEQNANSTGYTPDDTDEETDDDDEEDWDTKPESLERVQAESNLNELDAGYEPDYEDNDFECEDDVEDMDLEDETDCQPCQEEQTTVLSDPQSLGISEDWLMDRNMQCASSWDYIRDSGESSASPHPTGFDKESLEMARKYGVSPNHPAACPYPHLDLSLAKSMPPDAHQWTPYDSVFEYDGYRTPTEQETRCLILLNS